MYVYICIYIYIIHIFIYIYYISNIYMYMSICLRNFYVKFRFTAFSNNSSILKYSLKCNMHSKKSLGLNTASQLITLFVA